MWNTQSSEESKLESVLQLMDPDLRRPRLVVKFSRVHIGRLDPGQPRSKTMVIRNAGRGYLSGDLHLQDYDRGFTIDNSVVEGNETLIRLTARSAADRANFYPARQSARPCYGWHTGVIYCQPYLLTQCWGNTVLSYFSEATQWLKP